MPVGKESSLNPKGAKWIYSEETRKFLRSEEGLEVARLITNLISEIRELEEIKVGTVVTHKEKDADITVLGQYGEKEPTDSNSKTDEERIGKYFKVRVRNRNFFIKIKPGFYEFADAVEEYESNIYLAELISDSGIKGVKVIPPLFAYQDGDNTFFVSSYTKGERLDQYTRNHPMKAPELGKRFTEITEFMDMNTFSADSFPHNALYNEDEDTIYLFDVYT